MRKYIYCSDRINQPTKRQTNQPINIRVSQLKIYVLMDVFTCDFSKIVDVLGGAIWNVVLGDYDRKISDPEKLSSPQNPSKFCLFVFFAGMLREFRGRVL